MTPNTYYNEYTIVSCNRPHGIPEYFLIFQYRYVSIGSNFDDYHILHIVSSFKYTTPLPIEYCDHSLDDHFPYLNIKVIKTYSKQDYPEVYV